MTNRFENYTRLENDSDDISHIDGVRVNNNETVNNTNQGENITYTVKSACYGGIYHCMKLFLLLCQRYQYLPVVVVDCLSSVVLEPLLVLCIALFIYYIKITPFLYAVSSNVPSYLTEFLTHEIVLQYNSKKIYPKLLQDYLTSIRYFEQCLLYATNKEHFHCPLNILDSSRYHSLFQKIHQWIPKRALFENEYTNGAYNLPQLIQQCFNVNDVSQKEYKSYLDHTKKNHNSTKVKVSEIEEVKGEVKENNFIDMIVLARAQALTLGNVIENQFHKHLASS
jgi:hypothetical protein